jgi:hypothetical protein
MEKIVNTLIDEAVQKVDTYTNNGSTWLIFTDDKRWVIELTKDGTLWYNYNFFNNLFTYTSMDVIENQHYITKWVENNVINGVKHTMSYESMMQSPIDHTIENGVKEINKGVGIPSSKVDDTIEKGVKETELHKGNRPLAINDTIQHGVKETKENWSESKYQVEDIIQNGVKHTEKSLQIDGSCVIEDVINEGVKHTEYGDWEDGDERLDDIIQNGVKATLNDPHHRRREVVQTIKESIKETIGEDYHHKNRIDGVIKNGVKETLSSVYPIERVVEKVVEVGVLETKSMDEWVNTDNIVNKVMTNGIKEVQPLPAQDGNRDWGVYYYRKGEPTKPHTKYVDDVLEKGEKI